MSCQFSQKDFKDLNYASLKSMSSHVKDIENNGVACERPQKIGHYSVNISKETGTREMKFDESNLTYLNWTLDSTQDNSTFDLTESYDRLKDFQWANDTSNKLDEFLRWLIKQQNSLRKSSNYNPNQPLGCDFITYRGVLTKILITPFSQRDKWYIGACKFNGTIYLCPYNVKDFDNNWNNQEQNNLFSFGGYRFEHYLTHSNRNDKPFSATLNEYAAVIKSKLKSSGNEEISLLYAAEMDCLDQGKTDSLNLENFVEIKTTRKIYNENQNKNFLRFKLIKWWAQCYLAGIPKIVCGYKEQDNIVDQVGQFNVKDIPYRCSQYWTRRECLNFLYQFLKFVQTTLENENDAKKVFLFSNEMANIVSCKKLNDASEKLIILPDWYITSIIIPEKKSTNL